MYAVFRIGSKQYRVFEGQVIDIERVNYNIGEKIEFDQVLFIKDHDDYIRIGNPFVIDVKIIAKVLIHNLTKKIKIIKFRRRKHFSRSQGHRQCFTKIKIMSISRI